jgi:hypothetical protein
MIDDAQLDRLVDGELGEIERRELLSHLEAEPDGWRRCALAFLEGQSWREEMRSMSDRAIAETAVVARQPRSSWQRGRTFLAVAGSFLLALGLGLTIGNMFDDPPLPPPVHVAGVQPPEETIDIQPSAVPVRQEAPELAIPYQYVAIPAQDPVSGEAESVQMPVVPQQYLDEGWPYQLPSVLPDHVVQSLHQRGHDVVQQRRLVPFQAADGSRVVFPVDEVQLVPVVNRGYQ